MNGGCWPGSFQRSKLTQTALSKDTPCLVGCHLFNEYEEKKYEHEHVIDDAEKVLSKELYKLSLKEREDSLHDVHGVSDEVKEDPEFVQVCIEELEFEISK
jgi:hypothetical protein